jgi:hypothetical protein
MCFVNVESKKKQNVASLPRGAVDKGAFAEGFWQLLSATLGKIFPARVFPALPNVFARDPQERIFLKNKKPSLPTAIAPGPRHIFFKKINPPFRRPLPVALGTGFFKKIKIKTPILPTARP